MLERGRLAAATPNITNKRNLLGKNASQADDPYQLKSKTKNWHPSTFEQSESIYANIFIDQKKVDQHNSLFKGTQSAMTLESLEHSEKDAAS